MQVHGYLNFFLSLSQEFLYIPQLFYVSLFAFVCLSVCTSVCERECVCASMYVCVLCLNLLFFLLPCLYMWSRILLGVRENDVMCCLTAESPT